MVLSRATASYGSDEKSSGQRLPSLAPASQHQFLLINLIKACQREENYSMNPFSSYQSLLRHLIESNVARCNCPLKQNSSPVTFAYCLLCSHPKPRSESIFSQIPLHTSILCCAAPSEASQDCLSRSHLPLLLWNLGVGWGQRIKYRFLFPYLLGFTKQLLRSFGFPGAYVLLSEVQTNKQKPSFK